MLIKSYIKDNKQEQLRPNRIGSRFKTHNSVIKLSNISNKLERVRISKIIIKKGKAIIPKKNTKDRQSLGNLLDLTILNEAIIPKFRELRKYWINSK